jgi:hypothetical protein
LEEISESIHARRKLRQLWSHAPGATREPGVGAELDYDLVKLWLEQLAFLRIQLYDYITTEKEIARKTML